MSVGRNPTVSVGQKTTFSADWHSRDTVPTGTVGIHRTDQTSLFIFSSLFSSKMSNITYQGNRLPSQQIQDFEAILKIAQSPVVKSRPYNAQIKRSAPSAFVFLLDQSGSMSGNVTTAEGTITKAAFLAKAVNQILCATVAACEQGEDYANYIDCCVIGYGGDSENTAKYAWEAELAGADFVTIQGLTQNIRGALEDKTWISPVASSLTPMTQALDLAHDTLVTWLAKHPNKDIFPPIVINITDGEATDSEDEGLITAAKKIKNLRTIDGNVLFFNVHIAESTHAEVLFPCDASELPSDKHAHLLFAMSSDLPSIFDRPIANILQKDKKGVYSAMAYNANITSIVGFLNIGTTPTRERIK